MAPINWNFSPSGHSLSIDIDTPEKVDKAFSTITDVEAQLIETFIAKRKATKAPAVEVVTDLTQRRTDILNRNKQNYDKVCEETMQLVQTCEETDEYIKLGKLKLRKKPLTINVNHPKNKDKDVFTYEWDNYSGGKDTMVGIRQKVLNDDKNSMHDVVEDEIKAQDGYRQATKADFDSMLSELPWKNEEEKLLALQIVTGWFGWGMLDAVDTKKGKVLSRSFVRLHRRDDYRSFYTGAGQSYYGSVFLVQDCE